ncbi:uncharacterized protein TrAFT101_010837 [Trichoderma asperellum]|uniref:uncharacterized protein n=1 Tax=Trichoderma asperellum TaxID=101201 RepID=UPI0033308582|nr:hypothetical protein TrAFT101_010837 [Trichoderma asperellum]
MHKDQVLVKFRGKAKTKIEEGSVIIAGVSYRDEAATLLRGYLVFPRTHYAARVSCLVIACLPLPLPLPPPLYAKGWDEMRR